MKIAIAALITGWLLACGCADFGPAVSKSNMGNLEVNILAPEGLDAHAARVYVDELFVGNVSDRMPILQLKRGTRVIKVELEGAENYRESITILGEPNHQVLNVGLKKKTGA